MYFLGGLSVVLIFIIVGIYLWSTTTDTSNIVTFAVQKGEFVQQVTVSGKVVAARDVDLSFVQGGRVTKVAVAVGDKVLADTVLAETANSDLKATVLQKQSILESELAKLQALKNGTRPEEITIAESDLVAKRTQLTQSHKALIDAIQEAYVVSEDTVRTKVDIFFQNPKTYPQLTFTSANSQLDDSLESERIGIEAALTDWKAMLLTLSPSNDLAAATIHTQELLGLMSTFLENANYTVNQAVPFGPNTASVLAGYATGIATGRVAISNASAAFTTAVTAVKSAESAVAASLDTLGLKKAGVVKADIDAQAAQVKAARALVDDAKAKLEETVIKAPFDGIVTVVDAKVGAIAQAQVPQFSVISEGNYQIESYVPEINIALVEVGDRAEVTLDAYGDQERFPVKIIAIDPAETVRDGVSTYRAQLEIESGNEKIKAGMTANVIITTDRKESAISIPQKIVLTDGAVKYVDVLVGGNRVRREVKTGLVSSLGNIEILSGLTEGDLVIIPSP
jgi:HlyD family secretion protein